MQPAGTVTPLAAHLPSADLEGLDPHVHVELHPQVRCLVAVVAGLAADEGIALC